MPKTHRSHSLRLFAALAAAACVAAPARADETSCSPYTPLIQGQEDLVYVWTLGVKGVGDGSDKLVTIDVNPASRTYGKVVHKLSIGGRGEIHHIGLSDDRRYLWGGALDSNRIYVFDIGTDPAKPKLVRTIKDFVQKSGGYVGPHSFIALPGRMLVTPLSNSRDHGGETGIVVYNNQGDFVASHPIPKDGGGDGYGYDAGVNPAKNVFLTTSFTGWNNYMMDLGKLVKDGEAMKRFGNTSVMWDLKTFKPIKVFQTPGAPLEVRWSLAKGDNWALTTSALTSKMWMYKQDAKGEWQVKEVATIGDPAKIPLPVDISIARDGKSLWVSTFMDGTVRLFDLADHGKVREVYQKQVGSQVNMVSQSFDGKRVYVTTSLLGNWDKKGKDDEQFLKIYDWDGKELTQKVHIDFYKEKLGRAHHMKFQVRDLRQLKPLDTAADGLPLLAHSR
ncbi:MAG: selenium-binding protein [Rhodocyclaceae bacterium]|nr:selenium-binding protein [Rhodocyclaceae bacterium]